MPKVVIGIATFRRPRLLEQGLRALESLATDAEVRVIVADNDPERHEGEAVVQRLASRGYRFPIASHLVAQRGFTYGRERLLEVAFSDPASEFLAIMDDDQIPDPDWLDAMLDVQRQTDADIIGPAVWPLFEEPAPKWAITSGVYRRDTSTDGVVDRLYGDGGVLVACRLRHLLPLPWYDHAFAMSGGADSDLFRRLKRLGARFARASRARIYEVYPMSWVTLKWALSRAYRIGNTDVLLKLRDASWGRVLWLETPRIVGTIVLSPLMLLAAIGNVGRQVDAACRVSRAFGKIAALSGAVYEEYVTTHGN